MKVAILHYHLRRGGVTRVIEGQSEGLTEKGIKHVVLAGTAYEGECPLPAALDADLDYRDSKSPALSAEDLLKGLEEKARASLGGLPDIWHIHNHSLGKNPVYSEMISLLAKRGDSLLLQIHDFAADGRPKNFHALREVPDLFPIAPHIRYAFINSRDRGLLQGAGIPSKHCLLLPNPVTPPKLTQATQTSDHPLVLYPVRGIRRKNIGELCLLAALAQPGARFAVSLAPENKLWSKIHDRWGTFSEELKLPVELGVVRKTPPLPGTKPTFSSWLAHSTHLATTSIAEGFGLAFLEPLALGKNLIGRDLPEITQDFKEAGLSLGNLYEQIRIPLEMLDRDELRRKMTEDLTAAYHSYRNELTEELIQETWTHLTHDDSVDFGNLPESAQEEIIKIAASSPDSLPFSNWVRKALEPAPAQEIPTELETYGVSAYANTLSQIYQDLESAQATAPEFLPKQEVLAQFLKPARFHFLRT